MKRKLFILHLEDNDDDAHAIARRLKEQFSPVDIVHKWDQPGFETAFTDESFDIVLADFSLPAYSGSAALAFVRARDTRIPFIFVSGMIGETNAVEMLKAGATDYILKDSLTRLTASIERAMDDVSRNDKLREAEQTQRRLYAAIEQAGEGVMVTNADGIIEYVNPGFCRITGYSEGRVLGDTPSILKSGEHDRTFYGNLWTTISGGEIWSGRFTNRRANGELYHEDSVISPVRDDHGTIINYVAVKRDVSREVEMEEQLRQAQKMEAMGILAGGAAHDFNNILSIIYVSAELVTKTAPNPGPVKEYVQEILDAVDHGRSLTNSLLTFSRRQSMSYEVLNINDTVTNVSKMLQRFIGTEITINAQLDSDLWCIQGDVGQIEQILVNLSLNAKDAMANGGDITISTGNSTIFRQSTNSGTRIPPGDYVILEITDQGTGMPASMYNKIFEPFFTTKSSGRGTGLGLSSVYGIVKKLDGFIDVKSVVDEGTNFLIYFPRTQRELLPAIEGTDSQAPTAAKSILLVESDVSFGAVLSRKLYKNNFNVIVAQDGKQALALFERNNTIDLLLTDVKLTDVDGKQLADELKQLKPNLKVVYITGDIERPIIEDISKTETRIFCERPFTMKDLIDTITKVLTKG